MTNELADFTNNLKNLLVTIKDRGNELDKNSELLQGIYKKFITLGGLRLFVPVEQGGLGAGREECHRQAPAWPARRARVRAETGVVVILNGVRGQPARRGRC